MVLLKFFKVKNLIQIYNKTHQIAPFIKIFSGGACPRTPLAKRMASLCAACCFATCKFPNLKKKFLATPPPPKSWRRPWSNTTKSTNLKVMSIYSLRIAKLLGMVLRMRIYQFSL